MTCHTPWLKETEGMLRYEHFMCMKKGCHFHQYLPRSVGGRSSMIAALRKRPDIWAILDVACPEPPCGGSPLFDLPNIV